MSAALLLQLRATRAAIDAAIAELERGGLGDSTAAATAAPRDTPEPLSRGERPRKPEDPTACPRCGAPRVVRQNFGGFGGSSMQEICGRCAYEFSESKKG